ncbi:MAG TPA: phosphatase [Methylophaga aminisulfidivorans]|uniref:Phosphatase n=1 Tax=Methylophaga aminisulfidivorans TaxID=230105 RepID=A0A7C1VNU1_9GAMM|nr:phosphatase [Methylophaga aminisulfidivorans]
MHTTIKNALSITSRISSSGQPAAGEFIQISEQCYQAIINLAMPDSTTALAEEGAIVTTLGMTYVHVPVPFDAPDQTHLAQFFNIMKAFSTHKVWVHCALNYRASAFLYLYLRIVEHKPVLEAKRALLTEWLPNETWASFIKDSESLLLPE